MPAMLRPARPAPYSPALALLAVAGLRLAKGESIATSCTAFEASTDEVFRVLSDVLAGLGHEVIRSEPAAGMIWFEAVAYGEQSATARYRYTASICRRLDGGCDLLLEGKLTRRELQRFWVSPFRPDPTASILERMRSALTATADQQ